ncbi:MAG: hypothetical protein KJS45_05310 [Bacteroidetes bacterium]|nr:hypothetical protein [Bacteroidota bacterium]
MENYIKSVQIGNQIWMVENLNVDRFRNGSLIPEARTNEEWQKAGDNHLPAWCYYNNDPAHGTKYGKLYNWYAVNDPRGLASEGWHIPSDNEWTVLEDYLGGEEAVGHKMRSTSGWGWNENDNGSNTSGFSGLPGGNRNFIGTFKNIGHYGYWWSSTEGSTGRARLRCLDIHNGIVSYFKIKQNGFSVRCLRD